MSKPPIPSIKPNPRLAALAAAEARLKGSITPSDPSPEPPKEEKWEPPSEDDDRSKKRELARMLDRGIVRDNGYRETSECVATLSKISTNILDNPNERKYRTLKSTNPLLKTKILAIKGGHEFLIQLGFRTQTIDFTLNYVLSPSMKKLHELRLGAEVLQERVTDLSSRSTSRTTSDTLHKSDEAQRKARALREIEADRQLVRDRVERERIVREVREKARVEAERVEKERELAEGGEGEGDGGREREDGEDGGMQVDGGEYVPDVAMRGGRAGGGGRSLDSGLAVNTGATVNHGQGVGIGDEGSEEEDEEEEAGPGDYRPRNRRRGAGRDGRFGGQGRVLGKQDEEVKQEVKQEAKEE